MPRMDDLTEKYAGAYSGKILYLANKKLQPREELECTDNLAKLLSDLVSEALTKGTAGHGDWSIDDLYALIHEIVFSLVESEGDSGWRKEFFDGYILKHANGTYIYDLKARNALFSKALSRGVDKIRAEVFAKLPYLEFKKKAPDGKAAELSLKIDLEHKKSNFYVKYDTEQLRQNHLHWRSDPDLRLKRSLKSVSKHLETIEECLRSKSEEGVDPKVMAICRVWEQCFNSSQKQLIRAIVQHSPATASPTREEQQEHLQAQSHRNHNQVLLRLYTRGGNPPQQHQDLPTSISHDGTDNENDEVKGSKESESSHMRDGKVGVMNPEKTSPESESESDTVKSSESTTTSEEGIFGSNISIAYQENKLNNNNASALLKRAAPSNTPDNASASESNPSATKKPKTGVDTAPAAGAEETVETGAENTPVELDGTGDGNAAAAAAAGAEDAPEVTETDDESTGVVWWLHSIVMKRKLECDGTCDEGCGKAALAEWMSSKGDDWYGCKECIDKPSNDG